MKTTKSSSAPRRSRGRPREFDRDRALQIALILFWQRGYEGASISELVSAMGITPPALYSAFGSKEGLFREALDLYLKEPGAFAARAMAEAPTSREAFERMLEEATASYAGRADVTGCMVSTALLASAPENEALARSVSALRVWTREAMTNRVRDGIAKGELPADTDATSLALFFATLMQGMAVQAHDGEDQASLRRIASLAMRAWPTKHEPKSPDRRSQVRTGRRKP